MFFALHLTTMAKLDCRLFILLFHILQTCRAQSNGPLLKYRVPEQVPRGTVIANLIDDVGFNKKYEPEVLAELDFSILLQANQPPVPFVIDSKLGIISTEGALDREALAQCRDKETCELTLDAAIKPAQYFQIVKVTIEIIDINDNPPRFKDDHINVPIRESASAGSSFPLSVAIDEDGVVYGIHRYELISSTPSLGLKVVTRKDGSLEPRLVVQRALDREFEDRHVLKLIAYDGGVPAKSASATVVVTVLDSNDHSPIFDRPNYNVNVTENVAIGTTILRVHASDADIGINAEIVYRFSAQTQTTYGHLFSIGNRTGEIRITGQIDYETFSVHQLAVVAQDLGPDSLPVDAAVVVRVTDVNDNAPTIVINTLSSRKTDSADVQENLAPGTFVAHVSVIDPDGGSGGCNVSAPEFTLVKRYLKEYQIVTSVQLDREIIPQHDVEITCWDAGVPDPLISRKVLPVRILDANDNRPIFSDTGYSAKMFENNYIGVEVLHVTARDLDVGRNGEFHYSMAPGAVTAFDVEPTTGALIAKSRIDREKSPSFSFTVLAIDHGYPPLTGSTVVVIEVDDVNDERPLFSLSGYSFSVPENELEGTSVGTVSADDSDAPPNNYIRYILVCSGISGPRDPFVIDPDSGDVRTAISLDRELQSIYILTVLAADSGRPSLTGTASLTIYVQDRNDNVPVFQFPSSSNNTVHISNQVPRGFVIAQARAHDLDLDYNAKVTYQLEDGSDGGEFTIDPNTGDISVNLPLVQADTFEFMLSITARDNGIPAGRSVANLLVVVNSSVTFGALSHIDSAGAGHSTDFAHNLMIIITLACGSSLVTVVLLIFIAVLRRHRKKRSQRYKSRMEALRILTAKEAFHTNSESVPLTTDAVQNPPGVSLPLANGNFIHPQKANLEFEQESMNSGAGSNADSGHGHSEEEEMEKCRQLLQLQQQQQQQHQQQQQQNHLQDVPHNSRQLVDSKSHRFRLAPPPPPRISCFSRIYHEPPTSILPVLPKFSSLQRFPASFPRSQLKLETFSTNESDSPATTSSSLIKYLAGTSKSSYQLGLGEQQPMSLTTRGNPTASTSNPGFYTCKRKTNPTRLGYVSDEDSKPADVWNSENDTGYIV